MILKHGAANMAQAADDWWAREKQSGFLRSLEVSPQRWHCHVEPYLQTEETPASRLNRTEWCGKNP